MIGSSASQAAQEHGDLFEGRGTRCGTDAPQKDMGDKDLEGLSDKDLVGKIAKATLSNVELLCAQIVERGLGDMAVPGLVALWNRFKGFGIKSPLPEQQLRRSGFQFVSPVEISRTSRSWLAADVM